MESNKAIYIATIEANSGKSIIALGLMHLLLGRMARVGYFRPIINDYPEGVEDNHIATILSYFKIPMQYEEAYACTRSEVVQKNSRNQEDQVLDKIIAGYKAVESKFDFVLVEGTDFVGEGAIIEWDFNVLIAKNLGIPAIIISSGRNKGIEEFENSLVLACDSFADRGVKVLMVVANKIESENREMVLERLEKELPANTLIAAIPNNPALANPSIREIVVSPGWNCIVWRGPSGQPGRAFWCRGHATAELPHLYGAGQPGYYPGGPGRYYIGCPAGEYFQKLSNGFRDFPNRRTPSGRIDHKADRGTLGSRADYFSSAGDLLSHQSDRGR